MAPMETAHVTRKNPPKTVPKLRSILLRIMFKRRFGLRQAMDRARETTPATSNVALKNHQKPINFLDGILNKESELVRERYLTECGSGKAETI
jgi:hypothetical protein